MNMRNFKTIHDVLDFAIEKEVQANNFYEQLADELEKPQMSDTLKKFALDEFQHKLRLQAFSKGQIKIAREEVGSLDIADYLVDIEPH
jgi:rubrerythrin